MTEVHNHLEVVLPPGSVRDHAMLTRAANNALAADATVPEGVEATARNGNLALTGTVQYLSQRAAVEKVVSGLVGVRHARNEINVVGLLATGPRRPGHPGSSHTGLLTTSPACRT